MPEQGNNEDQKEENTGDSKKCNISKINTNLGSYKFNL